MSSDTPPARRGLSLYGNLLNNGNKSAGVISSGPVPNESPSIDEQTEAAAKKQQINAGT